MDGPCRAKEQMMMRNRSWIVPAALAALVGSAFTAPVAEAATVQLMQLFQMLTLSVDRTQAEAVTKYVMRMHNEMQTLFCRRVCESSKVAVFGTIIEFGKLMADNRIYYKA